MINRCEHILPENKCDECGAAFEMGLTRDPPITIHGKLVPARWVFKSKCGRKQPYARPDRCGGVTEGEIELLGWRRIGGIWHCSFCTGNLENLKKVFYANADDPTDEADWWKED